MACSHNPLLCLFRSATIIILQVLAVILFVFTIYVIIVPSPIDPVVVYATLLLFSCCYIFVFCMPASC